jgi:hypothetical protein
MDFRLVICLSSASLVVGFAGAAVAYILAGAASAIGFAVGAVLVAAAVFVSGGFFVRARARTAGQVMFRLAASSALKWMVLIGGAAVALGQFRVEAVSFTSGVIGGLVAIFFSGAHRGPRRPEFRTIKDASST